MKAIICAVFGFGVMLSADAASITLYDFTTNPGTNVTSRDGNMTVAYDGVGDYMTGTFSSQVFPSPQTDAFQIHLSDFLGDYNTPGITQLKFDLYAASAVAPSDLFLRLGDGVNVFSYQFLDLTGITASLTTFTVNLDDYTGWVGAGSGAFSAALANITLLEIELTRGSEAQNVYQLDNLQTLGAGGGGGGGGGGGPSAIPEPSSMAIMMICGAATIAWRRSRAFGQND